MIELCARYTQWYGLEAIKGSDFSDSCWIRAGEAGSPFFFNSVMQFLSDDGP
jgi:hypothetical protein